MNFVANVPYIKCYVRKEYLYDLTRGHGEFEECVLLAVKSMQGKALIFEAYLPAYGACYDKFPLSAFVWRTDIVESEQLPWVRLNYGMPSHTTLPYGIRRMLRNCDVEVYVPGKGKISGEYLFTIDSVHSDPNMVNTSVAEVPSEHKQFNVGKLVNGQFFAQPNNRMLWYEQSLTPSTLKTPDFKVASKYYFCEQDSKWVFGDSDDYFYKEKRT